MVSGFPQYLSLSIFIYLSMYRSIDLSIYRSIDLSIYLSIYRSIDRSIDLSIYRSIDLSIYLSIYMSTYLDRPSCNQTWLAEKSISYSWMIFPAINPFLSRCYPY